MILRNYKMKKVSSYFFFNHRETVQNAIFSIGTFSGFEKWIGYADLKPEPTYYGLPKSCEDLRGIGHTSFSSGMYPIMGEKRVEVVYCEFTKSQDEQGPTKLFSSN